MSVLHGSWLDSPSGLRPGLRSRLSTPRTNEEGRFVPRPKKIREKASRFARAAPAQDSHPSGSAADWGRSRALMPASAMDKPSYLNFDKSKYAWRPDVD